MHRRRFASRRCRGGCGRDGGDRSSRRGRRRSGHPPLRPRPALHRREVVLHVPRRRCDATQPQDQEVEEEEEEAGWEEEEEDQEDEREPGPEPDEGPGEEDQEEVGKEEEESGGEDVDGCHVGGTHHNGRGWERRG